MKKFTQGILMIIGCFIVAMSVQFIIDGFLVHGIFDLLLGIFIIIFNTIQLFK